MAELTADTIKPVSNETLDLYAIPISNGVQLYVGQYVDTSAGYLVVHVPAAGAQFAGIVVSGGVPGNDPNLDGLTGTNSIAPGASAATPPPTAVVNQGEHVLTSVPALTGAASTQADVGQLAYLTNGNDWSLAATNADKASGRVVGYDSASATWQIRVFAVGERGGY